MQGGPIWTFYSGERLKVVFNTTTTSTLWGTSQSCVPHSTWCEIGLRWRNMVILMPSCSSCNMLVRFGILVHMMLIVYMCLLYSRSVAFCPNLRWLFATLQEASQRIARMCPRIRSREASPGRQLYRRCFVNVHEIALVGWSVYFCQCIVNDVKRRL